MTSQRQQRVAAVLAHEPQARLPVSVWGHDFLREGSAVELAAQTIENQRRYGYDFVKINPRWTLFAEPWGNRYEAPTEQRFPRLLERRVGSAADLTDVAEAAINPAALTEHVDSVRMIVAELGHEVDCIATLFSPLATLGLLAGGVGQPLLSYLQEDPPAAHAALACITEVLTEHAQQLIAAGAAGIFFAPLPWTSLDVCPAEVYAEFGEPYDLIVLEPVTAAPLNMLHVCGNNIGMPRFYNYPVTVLNWDNFGPGNPTLAEVARESGKVVAGGVPHKRLHRLNADELLDVVEDAVRGVQGPLLLAGGCGIGAMTPPTSRQAAVEIADRLTF